MTTLQVSPPQLHANSDGLFFLLIVLFAIVIIVNTAKLLKRHQENSSFSDSQNQEKSDANTVSYGYTTDEGETLFDDVKPEDDEIEYRIVGTNYRDLSKKDIGYSENFCLNAADDVKDKYAVEVYNGRGTLVGYIERDLNKFWHKLLIKANPDNPVMRCRGYIGQFRNDNNELKFYGRIYLPEIDEKDPDYKKIMNS